MKTIGRWIGATLIGWVSRLVSDVEIGPLTNDYYGDDTKDQ